MSSVNIEVNLDRKGGCLEMNERDKLPYYKYRLQFDAPFEDDEVDHYPQ